jgi:hypothetical protein
MLTLYQQILKQTIDRDIIKEGHVALIFSEHVIPAIIEKDHNS